MDSDSLIGGLDRFATVLGDFARVEAMTLLGVIVYVMALFLAIAGLIAMARAGANERHGSSPFGAPLATFLVGVCLAALPSLMDAGVQTMFGAGTTEPSMLAYDEGATGQIPESARQAFEGVLWIVMLFGWIAVVRGLLKLKAAAAGSQQASLGSGITHLVGGWLAANIAGVIEVLQASFT